MKRIYFISQKHHDIFEKLNLQTDFLELSIVQWHTNSSFRKSLATVQALSVVNDLLLTKDEEQLQSLLQLAADCIKKFSNAP